jgi:enolase
MAKIKDVRAREILDSRGFPTLEADVELEDGTIGRAAVPSGASTGEHEAVELRDNDKSRFLGKGVRLAVENVAKVLGPAVSGLDARDQVAVDETMIGLDGSSNKGKLGANALLGVSMAAARAAAQSDGIPLYDQLRRAFDIKSKEYYLPAPMLNVINGGKHADSGLDIQEFMVVPVDARDFPEALRMGAEIYQHLKKILTDQNHSIAVGDEGGFAPHLKSHDEAIEMLLGAIDKAGYEGRVKISIDAAASEFYRVGKYHFEGQARSSAEMIDIYTRWVSHNPILSVEDPLAEDDWDGWKAMTDKLGDKTRIVGDDLFVTNLERLNRGIESKSANAILIKLNQIGTVMETVHAVLKAHGAGFTSIISHRSGETEDSFIADLAVATNAGAIKTGAPCRSERLAKYNQLLRIHDALGGRAQFAGDRVFRAGAVHA